MVVILLNHMKIFQKVKSTEDKILAIKIAILGLLFLLSFFWAPLIAIMGAVLLVFMLCEFDYKSIVYIFFFASWYYKYFAAVFWCMCLLYILICIFKTQKPINVFCLMLLPIILIIIFSYVGERLSWLFMSGLTTFFVLGHAREIGIKRIMNFFIFGVLIGCFIGLVRYTGWPSPMAESRGGGLLRFSSLTNNPNDLYPFIICAICAIFVWHLKTKKLPIFYFPIIGVLTAFGFLTISRGYFLVLFALVFVYLVSCIFVFRQKSIIPISICLCVLAVGSICVLPFTIQNFDRMPQDETVDANYEISETVKYDPGRLPIWKKNLSEWAQSPRTIFFGQGFAAPNIWQMNPHNFVVFILIKTGLVGLLLFLVFMCMLIYLVFKKTKFNVFPFLFLSCMMLDLIETGFPTFTFFMFIYFFILSAVDNVSKS